MFGDEGLVVQTIVPIGGAEGEERMGSSKRVVIVTCKINMSVMECGMKSVRMYIIWRDVCLREESW